MGKCENIVVCDSGFGGLDIARQLMKSICCCGSREATQVSISYFNAWPHERYGYNHLVKASDKQMVFDNVMKGICRFQPDLCIFACNTLSIIYHGSHLFETFPFEIVDIVSPTIKMLSQRMREEPEAMLVIVGTVTTVGSGYYPKLLEEAGIDGKRVISQACPYLSTMIEAGPDRTEVARAIHRYVKDAYEKMGGKRPRVLYFALCCTHYGYASIFWRRSCQEIFGCDVRIINPNDLFQYEDFCDHGQHVSNVSFDIYSRVRLNPERLRVLSEMFAGDVPVIADALNGYHYDEGLFEAPNLI